MDPMKSEIERIAEAKAAYRKKRAALSWPEKIRILVQLQERAAPILRARGEKAWVWRLDPNDPAMRER
jgi:hypothetical protein